MILKLLILFIQCLSIRGYEEKCRNNGCSFYYDSSFYVVGGWTPWTEDDSGGYTFPDLNDICDRISHCEQCRDGLNLHEIIYSPATVCSKCPKNRFGVLCQEDCGTCPHSCQLDSNGSKLCMCEDIKEERNNILLCDYNSFMYINGKLIHSFGEKIKCNQKTGNWEHVEKINRVKRTNRPYNKEAFTPQFENKHLIIGNRAYVHGQQQQIQLNPGAFMRNRGLYDPIRRPTNTFILLIDNEFDSFVGDMNNILNYMSTPNGGIINMEQYMTISIIWDTNIGAYTTDAYNAYLSNIRVGYDANGNLNHFAGRRAYHVRPNVTGCLPIVGVNGPVSQLPRLPAIIVHNYQLCQNTGNNQTTKQNSSNTK